MKIISIKNTIATATAGIIFLTGMLSVSLPLTVGAAGIEELVVTAQKREQSLGDVPISISVLTEDQIANSFSPSLEGLNTFIPSLTIRKNNAVHNNTILIRGLGTFSFSFAAEPSTSVVVDGVVLGRAGQAYADLYDIERIEVLKGPQGTLFGKNASAGVINITTKKVTDEFEASFITQFFTEEEYRATFKVSGPITDKLKAGVTLFTGQLDGYIDNRFDNSSVNGYDHSGARAVVQYDISDSLQIMGIYEQYSADDNCCYDVPGFLNTANIASNSEQLQRSLRLFYNNAQPGVNVPAGTVVANIETAQTDALIFDGRTINVNSNRVQDSSESEAFSFHVDKEYESGKIISITSFRNWDHIEQNDEDRLAEVDLITPGNRIQYIYGDEQWQQFSQEVRWDGLDEDTETNYSVGLYVWSQNVTYNFTRFGTICPGSPSAIRPGSTTSEAATACISVNPGALTNSAGDGQGFVYSTQNVRDGGAGADGLALILPLTSNTGYISTTINNTAVFFDLHSQVSDLIGIIAGARYTQDYVSYVNRRNFILGGHGPIAGSQDPLFTFGGEDERGNESGIRNSTTETNLSAKIGLDFKVDDENLVYLTYTEGYKGPAFNVFFNQQAGNHTGVVDPEESTNLELGWKGSYENGLVSVTYFSQELENYQANSFFFIPPNTNPIVNLTNAGSVTTSGIEVDFIFEVAEGVSINGGLAMIEARHEENNCGGNSLVDGNGDGDFFDGNEVCRDLSGLPLFHAPDLKWNIGVSVDHEMDNGSFIFNATYAFVDTQYGNLLQASTSTERVSQRADGRFCLDGSVTCSGQPGTVQSTTFNGEIVPVVGIHNAEIIDSYGILNFSIGYETPNDDFRVVFVMKNALDENFLTGANGAGYPDQGSFAYRAQISRDSFRHYGIELKGKFY